MVSRAATEPSDKRTKQPDGGETGGDPATRIESRQSLWLSVALAVLAVTAGWFFKWVADDGYIYLGYVKNILEHQEVGFNLGEPIDGCTGFAWLVLLALVRFVLPFFTYEQVSHLLSLGLVFSAVFLLVRSTRHSWVAVATVALLSGPYFMRTFFTSGLETPLIFFLIVHWYLKKGRSVLCAATFPFVRPELFLLSLATMLRDHRERNYRSLALTAAVGLGWAVFRFVLYGDVLPNTAFAKFGYATYGQGFAYAEEFVRSYWILLAVLGASLLALAIAHRTVTVNGATLRLAGLAALLTLYPLFTGGDFMHARFFMPAFLLAVLMHHFMYERLALGHHRMPLSARIALTVTTGVALSCLTQGSFAAQYRRENSRSFEGIVDERSFYLRDNPDLGNWRFVSQDKMARHGMRLDALAQHLGFPIGDSVNTIGQRRFYSDVTRVYLLDRFSLTQPVGTALQQNGYFRRSGHVAKMPHVFAYLNQRVNLLALPLGRMNQIMSVSFQAKDFVLWEPSRMAELEMQGVYAEGTRERLTNLLRSEMDREYVSDELLFFLYHRYELDDEIRAMVVDKYEQAKSESNSLAAWFERNRECLELYRKITRGELNSLPWRYRDMVRAHRLKALEMPLYLLGRWRIGEQLCQPEIQKVLYEPQTGDVAGNRIVLTSPEKGRSVDLVVDVEKIRDLCDCDGRLLTLKFLGTPSNSSRGTVKYSIDGSRSFAVYHEPRVFQTTLEPQMHRLVVTFKLPQDHSTELQAFVAVD